MEAEQKTLEHRVDFATIDLKLAEEYKAQLNTPAPSVLIELRNASINGFRNAFETLWALVLFFRGVWSQPLALARPRGDSGLAPLAAVPPRSLARLSRRSLSYGTAGGFLQEQARNRL